MLPIPDKPAPSGIIPTPMGVYMFEVSHMQSLSLKQKHDGERFIPLKDWVNGDPWVMTIEVSPLRDMPDAPSLWVYVKEWWRTRRFLKAVEKHKARRD